MLDDARVSRPGLFALPDRIWIARWDGVANTSTSYIREDGWRPGGRMKQYQGGHNETWGGVTINIDRNYLDLGARLRAPRPRAALRRQSASDFCGSTRASRPAARHADAAKVAGAAVPAQGAGALRRQARRRLRPRDRRGRPAPGRQPRGFTADRHLDAAALGRPARRPGAARSSKFGSAGAEVRRLQRALNAASAGHGSPSTGVLRRRPTGPALRDLADAASASTVTGRRGARTLDGPARGRSTAAGVVRPNRGQPRGRTDQQCDAR